MSHKPWQLRICLFVIISLAAYIVRDKTYLLYRNEFYCETLMSHASTKSSEKLAWPGQDTPFSVISLPLPSGTKAVFLL